MNHLKNCIKLKQKFEKKKILGFSSILCVFWRLNLEIIKYNMGRSVFAN